MSVLVVGGCGRIGLPLAIVLALAGNKVKIFDTNAVAVQQVSSGKFVFEENGGQISLENALASGNLTATADRESLAPVSVVIHCAGLLLDENDNPDFGRFWRTIEPILSLIEDGGLLNIQSTLHPGTLKRLQVTLEQHIKKPRKILLSYTPERLAATQSFTELGSLPQIVSAFDEESRKKISGLYSTFCSELIHLEPVEAEFLKLITNSWRYVNFSVGNQYYQLLEQHGCNSHRIFAAMKYHYPRCSHFPTPGFSSGPCLVKDTKMLHSCFPYQFSLGKEANTINEGMAEFSVLQLQRKLGAPGVGAVGGYPLKGVKVGLLGISFKGDSDDVRCSLSFKIKKKLEQYGATVLYHDPFYTQGITDLDTLVKESAGLIVATPHSQYRALKPHQPTVDVWGIYEESDLKIEKTETKVPRAVTTKKPTALITGSSGFIAGYVVQELLKHGYHVIGVENYSKYGRVKKSYDDHPDFELHIGDAKNVDFLSALAMRSDYILACAAMIGGIAYFHEFAYDLLAENERISAATFDAAIKSYKAGKLKKIMVFSSSMVFENSNTFPSKESDLEATPPPSSTYGFQKLACEYYARGAHQQYGLPFTIVRPFNCVGIGEGKAKAGGSLSHVLPDLILKIMGGQDPVHLLGNGNQVRCYTYGGDLARGIRLAMESPKALNTDFNLSTPTSTTAVELAQMIWKRIHGDSKPFRFVSDEPYKYDVQHRVPNVDKAREVLGFEATTTLDQVLDEVIPWVKEYLLETK